MRNGMVTTKRTMFVILGALVGAMLVAPLFPLVSEATHTPQLKGMVENGDHTGLAEFYKKKAEEARHNAAGMKAMASEYLKKYPKNQYAKHCEKMEDMFLEEAKHYKELAEMHSKAAKPAGK